MISKHIPSSSFYYTCRYIFQKQGSEILAFEGVRDHNYKLMASDFEMQHRLRPSKTMACFHGILSFYPGEKPENEKMREIALAYLKELKIVNTQYVVTKHTDKAHLHLHIVANMVNREGKSISDSFIGLRGKKLAQQLTVKYQLIESIKKDLKLTHLESLNQRDATRYQIYAAISEKIPLCKTIEELETNLSQLGINTVYKFKGQTKLREGVSFKMGNLCFKGSEVDRMFSYYGLEKTFSAQQAQIISQRYKLMPGAYKHEAWESVTENVKTDLEKTIEILMKPEENDPHIAYELNHDAERKQKRKHRLKVSR